MKKALRVIFGSLCAVVAYAFLFCGFCAAQDSVQKDYFCDDIQKPFFASDGKGEFCAQRRMSTVDKFSMPKPEGVKRVFVAGESVANILGPGNEVLGGNISGGGNAGFEIINCGMGGYESYRIYGVIKEVINYSPDLLVVLSGNNESGSESCPGLEFELRRREFRLLERYYTLKYGPQEARKKASLKMHENMLVKMARAAKKAGVPIVFCALPANVRDMPPRIPLPLEDGLFASGYRLFYDKKYSGAFEKFRLGLISKPHDYFLNFYMAKTLEKLGRSGEAGPYLLKAADFNEVFLGSVRERNGLVRKAAGSEGACVADLEKFFANISPGGLPGWAEFTDSMHWRPSYNKAVWEEIFRSAGACEIKGFEKIKVINPAQLAETPRADALKRLSYAFFWMDGHELNEGALAELSYIREKIPNLLSEAAISPERFEKLLIHNFWSLGAELRVKAFFPLFLAHLAETERRSGNYSAAGNLCERALALEPGNAYFRLERAQILAGLGKKKEAESEFSALAADPALLARETRPKALTSVFPSSRLLQKSGAEQKRAADLQLRAKARSLGLAYGFNMPAAPETGAFKKSPEEHPFKKDMEKSKKLSDSAVEKIRAGDFKTAEKLLVEALGINPSNPEALISLCSLRLREGKKEQALKACQGASEAVYANKENSLPGFEILACEAEFESYKILAALGRRAEAEEALSRAVKNAPASWTGLAEAKAALQQLKR
ncbi:MAG: tetratricopeptide repeat protein [Elusimicrobia bacterium]|nr:tetratricopeptide repeat protein [Elusimicrobiota bacterium]